MSAATKTRENTASVTGSTSSSVEIDAICESKNLDKTVRLQSEKRQEWIREIREERLQGNEKEQSCMSRVPDCKMGESQGEQKPHLGEREGNQDGSMERKG